MTSTAAAETVTSRVSLLRALCTTAPIVLAHAACVGSLETPGADDMSDEERAAVQSFEKDVAPILSANCAACHASMANIDFLRADPDMRTNLLGRPTIVNLVKPADSKLVTRGAHDGPALLPDQAAIILEWINLERIAAGGEDTAVELDPFRPIVGLNMVDLTPVGLTGSSITFRLEPLSVGMYLSEIMLHAGAGGAHLVHPLFVIWQDGTPQPDPVDRFAAVELAVTEGESAMVGGGTAVFVDVAPDSMLSLHFELAQASADGGGGGGGGAGACKAVDAFTASAQPALSASCVSCHGGGDTSATGATDMTRLNDLAAEAQAAACAQILSRVNLADPPSSGIFIAPDPGSGAGHPFKFAGPAEIGAFRDSLTVWINQENAQ